MRAKTTISDSATASKAEGPIKVWAPLTLSIEVGSRTAVLAVRAKRTEGAARRGGLTPRSGEDTRTAQPP